MLRKDVDVVAIEISSKCVKMELPNGKSVDILGAVFDEIKKWLQVELSLPESGGYITGYEHVNTGNISLESVSHPYPLDQCSRIHFNIRDPKHKFYLMKCRRNKSYYMGVWHTHPQTIPEPSDTDWEDWYQTLEEDKTGCDYIFYIIAGIDGARVWVGDFATKGIVEIFESEKREGIYLKMEDDSNEEN